MNNDRFKFRVWDKEDTRYERCENSIYINSEGNITHFDVCDPYDEGLILSSEDFIIQQGFKDKNGKPIFEGDILLYKSPNPHAADFMKIMSYDEKFKIVMMVDPRPGYVSGGIPDSGWEIIGNIFENPELLENK